MNNLRYLIFVLALMACNGAIPEDAGIVDPTPPAADTVVTPTEAVTNDPGGPLPDSARIDSRPR